MQFNDQGLLRATYTAMASLSNCSRQILEYMPRWLGWALHFAQAEDCPTPGSIRELWEMLGASEFIVEEVVELRLHMKDGRLYIVAPDDGTPGEGDEQDRVHSDVSMGVSPVHRIPLAVRRGCLSGFHPWPPQRP